MTRMHACMNIAGMHAYNYITDLDKCIYIYSKILIGFAFGGCTLSLGSEGSFPVYGSVVHAHPHAYTHARTHTHTHTHTHICMHT